MGKFEVALNHQAFDALLKSPEVLRDLERRGNRVAAAAGSGHETQSWIGATRARVTVRTSTKRAAAREAKDRTLLRALDAARGD